MTTETHTPSDPSWAARKQEIRRRFETLVPGYDRANRFISMGLDEGWRRAAVRAAVSARRASRDEAAGDGLWIDLASGTGAMARALAGEGAARIVRTDISPVVLDHEHALPGTPEAPRVAAESHALPLRGGCAAGVVMGFATRHVPSLDDLCREARRVLEPGGVVVLLDMDLGRGRLWGPLFRFYFRRILPWIGGVLTGQREAYRWMVRTVEDGPKAAEILRTLELLGFSNVTVRHLAGGAVYVVVGQR